MSSLHGEQSITSNPAYVNTDMAATQNRTTSTVNDGYEEAVDSSIEPAQQDLSTYNKLVSSPRPLSVIDSTTHRRGGRVVNPYAVDDIQESDDSPIVTSNGIINDGYEESRDFDPKQAYNTLNSSLPRAEFTPGEIYQTITEAKKSNPVRKLSRKLKQSFRSKKRRNSNRQLNPYAVDIADDGKTRGITNFVYEDVNDDQSSHQYADLGEAVPNKKPEPPSYPRRKPNKLYEPSDGKKKSKESKQERRCGCLSESQLIKLCLFVIIFLFLLCLFLVILVITGTVRVQADSPQGKRVHVLINYIYYIQNSLA